MTKPQTLDKRIAAALAETNADKSELTALVAEAEDTIAKARDTIQIESENELDLSNEDPDASTEKVWKAERTVARLAKAIPALRERIATIEAREYALSWNEQADAIEAERDKLANELADLYPQFVEKLIDLYSRIDANTVAINRLHSSAPRNEPRRLFGPELKARGLQSYTAHQPALRDNLKLPDWSEPTKTFPADPMAHWNLVAAESAERTVAVMNQKHALAFSPDWGAALEMQDEQVRQEAERRAEIEQREQADAKRKYERWLLETERKARLGLPADAKLEGH